ncbi:MAG: hypothetical protein A2V83_08745 [Nitrospirae bacterium RBG_16_64_22]|nr:MAG: hypothetical protein A2V83_08745 [Nitrospirae bacterium RBG_16_64_22]
MRKIKLVKCRLRQNGSSDVDNVRYVALEEFQLWRYYMEKAHGFAVEDPVVSYWVDAEALMEWAEQIAPERLEPVIEVYFYAHSVEGGTTVPIRRYLSGDNYSGLRELLLQHYPTLHAPHKELSPEVREDRGYFLVSDAGTA